MAEIGVSQKALRIISNIEQMDGQKGISSIQERNALAEALSNGEIDGGKNIKHIENLINEYDLKEAEKDASKDVISAIKKAMSMDGDKKAIDSDREAAVLDSIIDNTKGQYSSEDIKYAKAMKKTFGLSESTPLQEANARNEALETENTELKAENQQLLKELDERETEAQQMDEALNKKLAALGEENSALKDEIKALKEDIAKYRTDCKNLKAKINSMNNTSTAAESHNPIKRPKTSETPKKPSEIPNPSEAPEAPNPKANNTIGELLDKLNEQKNKLGERLHDVIGIGATIGGVGAQAGAIINKKTEEE